MLLDFNDQIDSFKYTDATTSQDSRVSNSKTLDIKRTLDITDLQVLRHFRTTLSILFLQPLLFLQVLAVLVIRPNKDVLVTRLISKALVEDWTSVFPLTPGQRVISKRKKLCFIQKANMLIPGHQVDSSNNDGRYSKSNL